MIPSNIKNEHQSQWTLALSNEPQGHIFKYVQPVFHTNLKYHKFLHKDDPWQGVSNHKRMSQCEIWPYCETPPVSHFRSEK